MAERFLARYGEELDALRQRAASFSKAFPKVAARLRLTGDVADDPHVERLVQSFAYSAARVRMKLDDEFPELTDGLLETLYPHYLAPIPSMSVVRFAPSATLAAVQTVPRDTEIQAEPVDGEACRFRTTQETLVAPLTLAAAALSGQPLPAPPSPYRGAASCLRLSLKAQGRESLAALGLSRLRLFLAGSWRQASAIAELLANHAVGIALARHSSDPEPVLLPASNLRFVGFDATEAMLPYPPTSFVGYRLLTEFFAFPQKFLFFDIEGLDRWPEGDVEIFVYLDQADGALEGSVRAGDFALSAAPVVNLFRQKCEPILLDGTRTEYRLLADSRRQMTREIHTVEAVTVSEASGQNYRSQPFFGRTRNARASVFWQVARRFDADDRTSDVDIAFVDERRRATGPLDAVASVDALCLNRDLPERLPFGEGRPRLELVRGLDGVGAVEALSPPTPSVRLSDADGRAWRLTSHLLLNHLSLADRGGGALRDILKLYAFRDVPETRQIIEAIVGIETRQSTTRVPDTGMVPGTEIELTLDPAAIDRASAFLFGAVLDRFFGLYTAVNSYTRLTVRLKGQSRAVARFAPRAAERPLL